MNKLRFSININFDAALHKFVNIKNNFNKIKIIDLVKIKYYYQ
jgi:hypothetical protein